MRILNTVISGCLEIFPSVFEDGRGRFVKTFHTNVFADHGLPTQFAEEYYTYSHQRVLRGLHFQIPPMEHAKLVTCVSGKVLDAAVDLRTGSPEYGRHVLTELSAASANMIYLPAGLAHGFYVLSESAVLMYKVTSVHSAAHDSGILWNSAGIPWPDENPVLSKRDGSFPALAEFESPFVYEKSWT